MLRDKSRPIRGEITSRSFVEELKTKPDQTDPLRVVQAKNRQTGDVPLAAGRGSVSQLAPARYQLGVWTQLVGLLEERV